MKVQRLRLHQKKESDAKDLRAGGAGGVHAGEEEPRPLVCSKPFPAHRASFQTTHPNGGREGKAERAHSLQKVAPLRPGSQQIWVPVSDLLPGH